jgi:hypothetical protein
LSEQPATDSRWWHWGQLLGFNLYWWLAVSEQMLWPLGLLLALHLLCSPTPWRDLRLLPLALFGCALDYGLTVLGLFEFDDGFPSWLVLLWLGFALTLAHGLAWLAALPRWQQAVLGGFGGAGSYLIGVGLGAVHLGSEIGGWDIGEGSWSGGIILLLIWCPLLPLLVRIRVMLWR